MDDYTFRLSSSIFPLSKYLLSDISCTFRHCQYSTTSIPTIAVLTVFTAQISTFDSRGINDLVLAFLVNNADITPNGEYFTQENRIFTSFPAFANASFMTNIKSASNIGPLIVSYEKNPFSLIFGV